MNTWLPAPMVPNLVVPVGTPCLGSHDMLMGSQLTCTLQIFDGKFFMENIYLNGLKVLHI